MAKGHEGKQEIKLDAELLGKIRVKFAEELDSRASQSGTWGKLLGPNIGERVICGEKVPRNSSVEMVLVRVAQDFGLKPDKTDELMKELLE